MEIWLLLVHLSSVEKPVSAHSSHILCEHEMRDLEKTHPWDTFRCVKIRTDKWLGWRGND